MAQVSIDNCGTCGKSLAEHEKERYYRDLDAWIAKDPRGRLCLHQQDLHDRFETGVIHDCDGCAVDRLRREKEADTFMNRAIAGGPEGLVFVAIGFLVLFVIMFGAGR